MKHKFFCQPINAEGGFLPGGGAGKETMEDAQNWAKNHLSVTPACTRVAIFKIEGVLARDPPPTSFKKIED